MIEPTDPSPEYIEAMKILDIFRRYANKNKPIPTRTFNKLTDRIYDLKDTPYYVPLLVLSLSYIIGWLDVKKPDALFHVKH